MRGLYDNINPNNNNFTTYFFYTVDDGNEIENNYNGYSNDKNKGSNTNNTNKENHTGNASSSSCTHYSILSWNIATSIVHLIQAIVVLCLIPILNTHEYTNPIYYGRYQVRKNVHILQDLNEQLPSSFSSVCKELPLLHGEIFNTTINNGSISVKHHQSNPLLLVEWDRHHYKNISWRVWSTRPNEVYPYEDAFVVPHSFEQGIMDVRYMIVAFFFFSFAFQMLNAILSCCFDLDTSLKHLPLITTSAMIRFLEYSISSSLMLMAIALELGMNDIYTLVFIFVLMFVTNILGLITECVFNLCVLAQEAPLLWLVPHALGWVTCLTAYAPILDTYSVITQCSSKALASFVTAVVIVVFVLFNSFGFVQLYILFCKTKVIRNSLHQNIYDISNYLNKLYVLDQRADVVYIALSLTAKTILGWLILSPMLYNYVS